MNRLYKTELAIEVMSVKLTSLKRLPLRATPGAAGYDLQADADVTLHVGEIIKVPTGVSLEIPEGFEGQVRSRSGLASKGVIVVNSPGTIDSDYRGEIQVLLMSLKNTHEVKKGDRIAQLVFAPVVRVELFKSVSCLDETERGEGGFGSTDLRHKEMAKAFTANLQLKPIKQLLDFESVDCKSTYEACADFLGIDAEIRERRLSELDAERAGKYAEVYLEGECEAKLEIARITGTFTVKDEET